MTQLSIPVATNARWRLPFSKVTPLPVLEPKALRSDWAPHKGDRLELPSGRVVEVLGLLYGGYIELGYLRGGKVVPKGHCSSGRVALTLAFLRQYGRPA